MRSSLPLLLGFTLCLGACRPLAAPLILTGDVIEGSARLTRAAAVGTGRLFDKEKEDPATPEWQRDERDPEGADWEPPPEYTTGDPYLESLPPIVED
jgi:hypothetical protein